MREPHSRDFSSLQSSQESWLHRVRENFQQVLTHEGEFPSSANGAPLHTLNFRRSATESGARTASLLTHTAVLSGMLLIHFSSPSPFIPGQGQEIFTHTGLSYSPPPEAGRFGRPSLGRKGGGGEEDPRPARHGWLPPGSSVPLAPPRRIVDPEPVLPVAAAVFDPTASQFPPSITRIGLPWTKNDSDSAGPGKRHGIGSGLEGGVGDDTGPDAGQGEVYGGPYANVKSLPRCAYCPDPQYTDEAREAKLQGKVTLRVLVGADGRAKQVRVVQGIGMGLEEQAVQAIHGWKFVPAQDAARRTVAAWVTVEAVFRLF